MPEESDSPAPGASRGKRTGLEGDLTVLPQHAALIAASGIAEQVAAARGYRTITRKAELKALGFGESQARVPALLIPVHNVVGDIALYQARPDVPRIKDGKALKYETPLGARMVLDVPPLARYKLGDPTTPLFITEGVRKADSAVSRGLCCVALLGVWNWRGTNKDGGKVALPDWESVGLSGRQTYIVFDSDVMLKPEVHGALSRLKGFLESRVAKVAVIYLPAGEGGSKVGLDDYFAAGHSVDELLRNGAATLRALPDGADEPDPRPSKGCSIELEDPEPAGEAVAGSELLDEIVALLNKYIVLPSHAGEAIALWITHTYLMDAFDITPVLALSSPTKRCGKTSLLRIIRVLVRRALPASGISAAAIYRTVEEHEPTLLIDEMDSMKDNEDLRGVLNSGHTRDLAYVIRVVGEGANQEPRRFSTWCPKVLAHIGRLSGTLEDRAIRISMRRKLAGERRERIRRRHLEVQLGPVRRRIARWAQDLAEVVPNREPVVPAELDDRAADNWEPLLAVADAAGGRWPQLARSAALSLSSERAEDERDDNPGLLILADLRELIESGTLGDSNISGDEASTALRELSERPWKAWGRGRDGLQPVHLAKLLKPFGVVPKAVRVGGRGGIRRYLAEALQDAFGRYLATPPDEPSTPATPPDPQRIKPIGSTTVGGVADVAGSDGRCGSDGPVGIDDELLVDVATALATDPNADGRDRQDHPAGDVLPDGRPVLEVIDGLPISGKAQ